MDGHQPTLPWEHGSHVCSVCTTYNAHTTHSSLICHTISSRSKSKACVEPSRDIFGRHTVWTLVMRKCFTYNVDCATSVLLKMSTSDDSSTVVRCSTQTLVTRRWRMIIEIIVSTTHIWHALAYVGTCCVKLYQSSPHNNVYTSVPFSGKGGSPNRNPLTNNFEVTLASPQPSTHPAC